MPRVIHFEIPADNTARAVEFYKQVFGWKFQKWEGGPEYWLISTGGSGGAGAGLEAEPGIDGGLLPRHQPGRGTVNTVGVPSVDEYTAAIEKAGGKVVAPKMAVPGVGWLAYCEDPEGNMFGLMQRDASAH